MQKGDKLTRDLRLWKVFAKTVYGRYAETPTRAAEAFTLHETMEATTDPKRDPITNDLLSWVKYTASTEGFTGSCMTELDVEQGVDFKPWSGHLAARRNITEELGCVAILPKDPATVTEVEAVTARLAVAASWSDND